MKILIFWILIISALYSVHSCEGHAKAPVLDRETRISQARYLLREFGYKPKQIAEIINHS